MKELSQLRGELDGIDRELLALFERRLAVCGEIAAYKQAHGLAVLDSAREEEKLRAIRSLSEAALRDYTEALWREIMALSRRRQRELTGRECDE